MQSVTNSKSETTRTGLPVLAACWLVLFVLYLPAATAGRVGDFPGWVTFLRANNFLDYINRKGSGIPSMYQFTQAVTWCFYQVFGVNAWCWHLLHITLQALNAWLLFLLFRRLFEVAGVGRAAWVAAAGSLLFCVTPGISEVVVWEPSFHYLLGLLLMVIVLLAAQRFAETGKAADAWLGGVVFFASSYSLEVFYLTPVFVTTLALFYRSLTDFRPSRVRGLLLCFVLPEVLIFVLHLAQLRWLYHSGVAHVGTVAIQFTAFNFAKALKYVFHVLFFGRFFPQPVRNVVYHFSESTLGLFLFYGSVLFVVVRFFVRYRHYTAAVRVQGLLFFWVACATGLILPLWLPDTGLVIYDRYTYLLDAFVFFFIAVMISSAASQRVFAMIIGIYAVVSIRYTHKVNTFWQQSAHIVHHLLETFPASQTKKVLLLNLPECLCGVQMVGTRDDGEFRMMYNAIMPRPLQATVYDVEAFYMSSPGDGAHVNVVNDSTVKVTLNQWGTWWLYYGYGATSYENADYKVIMRDQGHWYDLIVKHPMNDYLLLYTVGDAWRTADQSKKNIDQY